MGNCSSAETEMTEAHSKLLAVLHPSKRTKEHAICYVKDDSNGKEEVVQWGWLIVDTVISMPKSKLVFRLHNLQHEPIFASDLVARWSKSGMLLHQGDADWRFEMSLEMNQNGVVEGDFMLRKSEKIGFPYKIHLA